jgi:hypothetical protein
MTMRKDIFHDAREILTAGENPDIRKTLIAEKS